MTAEHGRYYISNTIYFFAFIGLLRHEIVIITFLDSGSQNILRLAGSFFASKSPIVAGLSYMPAMHMLNDAAVEIFERG